MASSDKVVFDDESISFLRYVIAYAAIEYSCYGASLSAQNLRKRGLRYSRARLGFLVITTAMFCLATSFVVIDITLLQDYIDITAGRASKQAPEFVRCWTDLGILPGSAYYSLILTLPTLTTHFVVTAMTGMKLAFFVAGLTQHGTKHWGEIIAAVGASISGSYPTLIVIWAALGRDDNPAACGQASWRYLRRV
ncbi:hypothetical protein HDZ31DRAFT_85555 [Schizophyllum fasciatum]